MPEWELFYSPLSRSDLDDIYDYIAFELENSTAAHETISAILDCVEKLEDFPFIGSIVERLPLISDEYRFLGVRNYSIFYRLSKPRIFIDRILYCKREYNTLLGLQ